MINWRKEFERKRSTFGNVVLIEFASGKAVVIPKNTPLNQVNELAQAQHDKAVNK